MSEGLSSGITDQIVRGVRERFFILGQGGQQGGGQQGGGQQGGGGQQPQDPPELSEMFTAQDVGGYYDTTDVSLLEYPVSPLVQGGTFTRINNARGAPHRWMGFSYGTKWGDNQAYWDVSSGRPMRAGIDPVQNISGGYLYGVVFSHENTASDSNVDCGWMNEHTAPNLQFSAGNGKVYCTPFIGSASTIETINACNDGEPHTFIMNYLPANGYAEFFLDGVSQGTVASAGVDTGTVSQISMVSGDRDGLNQDAWRCFGRCRGGTADDVAKLHALLMAPGMKRDGVAV